MEYPSTYLDFRKIEKSSPESANDSNGYEPSRGDLLYASFQEYLFAFDKCPCLSGVGKASYPPPYPTPRGRGRGKKPRTPLAFLGTLSSRHPKKFLG